MNLSNCLLQTRRIAAGLMFVAALHPFEAFSACMLTAAPLCVDSTPCRTVVDSNNNSVTVCLSTATSPPAGALISSASCWQVNATYKCLDDASPKYSDTCAAIKNGGKCAKYQENSVVCNPFEPKLPGGACALFDVTYQCEVSAGRTYNETTCNKTSACTDANGRPAFCTGPVTQETDKAFASMTAQLEASRQAGVYMQDSGNPGETDPTKLSIFNGTPSRCQSQTGYGIGSNCCEPDRRGASLTNSLVITELIKMGWNAGAKAYLGSEYTYDTLFDETVNWVKGLNAAKDTASTASTVSSVATAPDAPASTFSWSSLGNGAISIATAGGGIIGGAVMGAAAGQYASSKNANTGWAGTIAAAGNTVGTVVGTYATSSAIYGTGYMLTGVGWGAGGASSVAALNPYLMAAMFITAMIMSFIACTPEDMKTQLKLGAGNLCHFVGNYCNTRDPLGGCVTTYSQYCCYNSSLAKIIQEGAREQAPALGGWGTPQAPNCGGIKVSDLAQIDFSKIDMSAFAAEITVKTTPDPAAMAEKVRETTTAFMDSNSYDPTITNGLLVHSKTVDLPPPTVTVDLTPPPTPPAMNACNVAFAVTQIYTDGSATGTFNVSSCNPGALIVWNNQGTCAAAPATSPFAEDPKFTSSTVDSAGNATFMVTLPASCFAPSTPAIQNLWKGMVTLSPHGIIGNIFAVWK